MHINSIPNHKNGVSRFIKIFDKDQCQNQNQKKKNTHTHTQICAKEVIKTKDIQTRCNQFICFGKYNNRGAFET